MDKNHFIQLTNNLYKLTLLFPKKEPLRYKMREQAVEILAQMMGLNPGPKKFDGDWFLSNSERLEVLDGFFEIAKAQNWVPVVEVLRLQEEYSRIRAEIKKLAKRQIEKSPNNSYSVQRAEVRSRENSREIKTLSERQEKILAFLKEQGRVQVWQVKQILPEVTKRTLRRDFDNLLKKGMVERIGERNETFYQIKYS